MMVVGRPSTNPKYVACVQCTGIHELELQARKLLHTVHLPHTKWTYRCARWAYLVQCVCQDSASVSCCFMSLHCCSAC
jgi:hypothetical protein